MQLDDAQWLELKGSLKEIHGFLHGTEDRPGLAQDVAEHREILKGDTSKGTLGLVTKVAVLWRTYIWLACTVSGIVGWFLRDIYAHQPK